MHEHIAAVCLATGVSRAEYAVACYEAGEAYLERNLSHDKESLEMLRYSNVFWSWWKHQWRIRETPLLSGSSLTRESWAALHTETQKIPIWPKLVEDKSLHTTRK